MVSKDQYNEKDESIVYEEEDGNYDDPMTGVGSKKSLLDSDGEGKGEGAAREGEDDSMTGIVADHLEDLGHIVEAPLPPRRSTRIPAPTMKTVPSEESLAPLKLSRTKKTRKLTSNLKKAELFLYVSDQIIPWRGM